MTLLTVDVPDTAFAAFKQTPAEFVRSMKITALVKWYEDGRISQSKAAEIAGISRQEFLEHLYEHKVSPYQLTPEELIDEVG
jgi:predicted HTH domain antitoxin